MENTFYNAIEEIEQNLLIKYVDSVKRFNKAYFANKQEAIRQQRKIDGDNIDSLIRKINENYMKNGNSLDNNVKEEEDYSEEMSYEVEKRGESSSSCTPYNLKSRKDLHNKTTGPSYSFDQKYRNNKNQASSSRVPFQIFDHPQTPQYQENYEEMDVDSEENDEHDEKPKEFSLWDTPSP
jgi:hypothetical protein